MSTATPVTFEGLPGEELIRAGLRDYAAGMESVESLLVEIARPRLSALGLLPTAVPPATLDAELRLHRLLARTHGDDAYGQYNALLRRLVSFERALDQRMRLRGFAAATADPGSAGIP